MPLTSPIYFHFSFVILATANYPWGYCKGRRGKKRNVPEASIAFICLFVSPQLCQLRMNSPFSVSPCEWSIKLGRDRFRPTVSGPQTHRLEPVVMSGSGDTRLAASVTVGSRNCLSKSSSETLNCRPVYAKVSTHLCAWRSYHKHPQCPFQIFSSQTWPRCVWECRGTNVRLFVAMTKRSWKQTTNIRNTHPCHVIDVKFF